MSHSTIPLARILAAPPHLRASLLADRALRLALVRWPVTHEYRASTNLRRVSVSAPVILANGEPMDIRWTRTAGRGEIVIIR